MELCARDLMQKDVGIVEAEDSLADLERCFDEARVSGFPVVSGGLIVGVVSRTDVLRQLAGGARPPPASSSFYAELAAPEAEELLSFARAARDAGGLRDIRVRDVMTEAVVSVAPEQSIEHVAEVLCRNRVHRVLVVDDRALLGIISSLDVVRLVAERKLVRPVV